MSSFERTFHDGNHQIDADDNDHHRHQPHPRQSDPPHPQHPQPQQLQLPHPLPAPSRSVTSAKRLAKPTRKKRTAKEVSPNYVLSKKKSESDANGAVEVDSHELVWIEGSDVDNNMWYFPLQHNNNYNNYNCNNNNNSCDTNNNPQSGVQQQNDEAKNYSLVKEENCFLVLEKEDENLIPAALRGGMEGGLFRITSRLHPMRGSVDVYTKHICVKELKDPNERQVTKKRAAIEGVEPEDGSKNEREGQGESERERETERARKHSEVLLQWASTSRDMKRFGVFKNQQNENYGTERSDVPNIFSGWRDNPYPTSVMRREYTISGARKRGLDDNVVNREKSERFNNEEQIHKKQRA